MSRARRLEFDLFGYYIRHNFSQIGLFSKIKTSMDSLDMQWLRYELKIDCWGISDEVSSEKLPFLEGALGGRNDANSSLDCCHCYYTMLGDDYRYVGTSHELFE